MNEIRFQVLENEKDLRQYQTRTHQRVGVELPMAYLEKARVLGLKDDRTGEIFGGFTLAYQGSLRCLEQLPKEVQDSSPLLKKFKGRFFEINGLWLDHNQAPEGSRFQLYLHCMQQAGLLTLKGKSKYVYAYCADNQKLREFYRNFNSKEIYEGPVELLPGMKEAGRERVEMGCMLQLPWTVARNPLFLAQRAGRAHLKALESRLQKMTSLRGKRA